jgi:hypothetical protein
MSAESEIETLVSLDPVIEVDLSLDSETLNDVVMDMDLSLEGEIDADLSLVSESDGDLEVVFVLFPASTTTNRREVQVRTKSNDTRCNDTILGIILIFFFGSLYKKKTLFSERE